MTYVYKRTEPSLWTVGFYTPEGKWEPDSDHDSPAKAAKRVHYLNGGQATAPELLAALQELTLRANQLIESAEANPTGSMVAVDMQDLGRLHIARDKAEQALARAEAPGSGETEVGNVQD